MFNDLLIMNEKLPKDELNSACPLLAVKIGCKASVHQYMMHSSLSPVI